MPRPYSPRQPRVERACRWCGATFSATAAQVRQGGGIYCSRACMRAQNHADILVMHCLACGKDFRPSKSLVRRGFGKFCSSRCYGDSMKRLPEPRAGKHERSCEVCGNHFFVYPARIRKGEARFCSQRCYGVSQTAAFPGRFWSHFDRSGDCWLWTLGLATNGYGKVGVPQDGGARHAHIHRVAWELTHGPIPKGMQVLHRCDVRHCGRPDHLFLGTQADNMRDMAQKGRSLTGDRNPMSRVSVAARRKL